MLFWSFEETVGGVINNLCCLLFTDSPWGNGSYNLWNNVVFPNPAGLQWKFSPTLRDTQCNLVQIFSSTVSYPLFCLLVVLLPLEALLAYLFLSKAEVFIFFLAFFCEGVKPNSEELSLVCSITRHSWVFVSLLLLTQINCILCHFSFLKRKECYLGLTWLRDNGWDIGLEGISLNELSFLSDINIDINVSID